MSSRTSGRLRVAVDKHQHGEVIVQTDESAIPGPPVDPDAVPPPARGSGRLWRERGRVLYQDGAAEPVAVKVVWARPLSGRGGPVSLMLAGKKKEVAYFPSVDLLSGDSRRIALEELAGSMILPRITAIARVWPRFGNYYWDVETDMGRRKFLLSAPENNSIRPAPDHIVVRDVSGNCYEINPVSGLDAGSLRELDRVL